MARSSAVSFPGLFRISPGTLIFPRSWSSPASPKAADRSRAQAEELAEPHRQYRDVDGVGRGVLVELLELEQRQTIGSDRRSIASESDLHHGVRLPRRKTGASIRASLVQPADGIPLLAQRVRRGSRLPAARCPPGGPCRLPERGRTGCSRRHPAIRPTGLLPSPTAAAACPRKRSKCSGSTGPLTSSRSTALWENRVLHSHPSSSGTRSRPNRTSPGRKVNSSLPETVWRSARWRYAVSQPGE